MSQNLRRPPNILAGILGFITCCCGWLAPFTAAAVAQMQDGQDYPASTSTPTTGRSPWFLAGTGAAAASSTSYIGIYLGDLTGTTTPALAGLPDTINPEVHLQIARAASSSRTYYRSIGASISNNSAYFSFLVNLSGNPTTNDEVMCELIPAVAGGSYPANPSAGDALTLHAQMGADTGHFYLGIQSLAGAVSWATNVLADATDYLVVMEFTFGAGQPCQLFINPAPGAAQPPADATATKGATADPTGIGTVLFWESSTNTTGAYSYDAMRVDANWTNVTPAAGSTITPMRVLFVGDSLLGISTAYSNDIPAILGNLAGSFGDAYTYTKIASNAWYLAYHATNPPTTNAIVSGNYDLVVLQDQSAAPSLPSLRTSEMFPACQTLNGMITNHDEQTMFYETWGYLDGDPNNCDSYDIPPQYLDCDGGFGSFLSMNISVRQGYAEIGGQLNAAISPVGLAWAAVRQAQPDLNLYILDDSYGNLHPNSYGAYLAACVFYSAIFGRSPVGSTYYSTNDVSSAIYLQQVAAATVLTDPFAPDAYGFGTNNFYWARRWQNYTNPPSAPANTIIISGASATPSPSVRVDVNAGGVSNLWLGTFDTNYNLAGQGRLYFASGGSLVVTGAMIVGQGGEGFVQHNGGTLVVDGALTLAQQTNSTGQYTLSNGTLYASEILAGAGKAGFCFQGGQLGFAQFGSATQPLNLNQAGGTLAVTNDAPVLIYGNFTNSGGSTLSMQLGDDTNTMIVSGTAALAGTLQLNYAPGWQPQPGRQFVLLSASAITGGFTNIIFPAVSADGLGLVSSLTASSVVATVTNFTPGLKLPMFTGNGIFQFTLTGVPGSSYVLQASTNLTDWTSLLTNAAPFNYQETTALPSRFYRAIYLP